MIVSCGDGGETELHATPPDGARFRTYFKFKIKIVLIAVRACGQARVQSARESLNFPRADFVQAGDYGVGTTFTVNLSVIL
jgi:hypothetical protein